MKRTLILAATLVLAAGVTLAGDYHTGDTLNCSQCHVMHAETAHSYGGGGTSTIYTQEHYLLKGPVNDMCLACHDGQPWAADVLGLSSKAIENRSAGALNKVGLTVDALYSDYMGHSLGSTATAPGGTFAATGGLSCVDCHHQHGYAGSVNDVRGNPVNSAYRNVRAMNGQNISYAIGTNNPTKDVYETATRMYETVNVNLNEPVPTDSGVADWCAGCHGEFHGDVGGAEIGGSAYVPGGFHEFERHPSATVNIGETPHGHSDLTQFAAFPYRVRVMSYDGDWGAQGAVWDTSGLTEGVTPTCLTCHKGHGNAKPFGLIYADGTGTATTGPGEDGAGLGARDLCRQCHVQ